MPTLEGIVGRGYLPKELPTPFTSTSLASMVASRGFGAFAGGQWLRPVTHNLARPGRMYRRLAMPHPVHFVRLADVIASNWTTIEAVMSVSKFSLSTAVDDPSGNRAIAPQFRKTVRVARRATAPPGTRFVVRADVSQFYPSVYTHALDWAFSSRSAAKLAAKSKSSSGPGPRVDQLVAWAQDGQTMGIPIGPDTSFALGEMVMSRVDETLMNGLSPQLRRAVRGTRFYDDYELFAPDRSAAVRVAAELQRALDDWELTLNPYKFWIDPLPIQLDDEWIAILKQINVSDENSSSQRAGLITLFSEAFRLRGQFRDDNVLAYAIGQFIAANFVERQVVFKENWTEFEGLVLQCAEAEPATLPRVAYLLAWYDQRGYNLNRASIGRTLQSIVTTEGVSAHGSEVAWAIWAAILLDIKLGAVVGRTVSRMDDDIVALVALHARSLGLIAGIDTSRWTPHMSRPGLFEEHWLLAYEALHHGWLPSGTRKDYTKGEPLFGLFRRTGVCFYDEAAQVVAPAIVKRPSMPGHVAIANLAELTDVHREAIQAVLEELELTQDRGQGPIIVVRPEDLY
jgi:hypothetical protein